MSPHLLKLQNIKIAIEGKSLLDIDCEISGGEIYTVMGPSGSGKSSLLSFIAGFLSPAFTTQGEVFIDGKNLTHLPAEKRKVGLLFQDPLLFPHLSVAGNLRFGISQKRNNKDELISSGLSDIGLAGFEDRDPHTLSGGQKSRVALLRLLLSEPNAVLLDEPFNKLDSHLRRELRAQVFDTLRATGLPTILVTHDHEDAEAANGTVVVLK
ncbi:MAG: ABC transporter ATP-binding protein [SAR86 cluster bacterium]|uniref:ABC transporter ATP-binding protein n=1 Tax=SAR86 cluster bacterium TaxID=2030880 RepID=A0A2A5AW36_9GAMM|nr:MAG: ABC transporter ATP-binding protein [SAR86 cluster bacterium]